MDKLLDILCDIRDDVDFDTCDDLIDGKILTSFDIIQILAALDDEYDIAIPATEIIPENFNSAQAIYDLVQRLKGFPERILKTYFVAEVVIRKYCNERPEFHRVMFYIAYIRFYVIEQSGDAFGSVHVSIGMHVVIFHLEDRFRHDAWVRTLLHKSAEFCLDVFLISSRYSRSSHHH